MSNMSYWQLSDEEDRETVKSQYEPVVKFSYTNPDKAVTPTSDKSPNRKLYAWSGLGDYTATNKCLYVGSNTESFYSASKPHSNETNGQNGSIYEETHFCGSYDLQNGADHYRRSPDVEGSFRGVYRPLKSENICTNSNKNILFKECTYEERQDEINRLLRNNVKNEKYINGNNDEVLTERNKCSLVSYRGNSDSIERENSCAPAPVDHRQLSAFSTRQKSSSAKYDSSPDILEHRKSTDSETFESEIFVKMTPTAVEKVKKVTREIFSEQSTDSPPDSPIDFLSRRAVFESNTVYKNTIFRPIKTTKTTLQLNSTCDKRGGNNFMAKYLGNVTIPFRSSLPTEIGFNNVKHFLGKSQKSTTPHQTGLGNRPSQTSEHSRQSAFGSKTTKFISQSHPTVFCGRSTKESTPFYLKDYRDRNQRTNYNLSRYGTSVQEEKLLRQSGYSKKNEKTYHETSVANDDDKSSDYESLSTSMETVIDCSSTKNPERCSSVDTGMHRVGKYTKRVSDIVRLFNEMETQQNVPDGYYTWQDYKMRQTQGLKRWDDPLTDAGLSKSYSNIVELQQRDSPMSGSGFNISTLNNSFETPASQNWSRSQSVDMFESSRHESRNRERFYDVTRTADNSPYLDMSRNYEANSAEAKAWVPHDLQSSVSSLLVPNCTNSLPVLPKKKVNNSLFHDERHSAFERHTPTKPMPEHHYENVYYPQADSSKNSYQTERNESSFINTQRMSNLINQSENRAAEPAREKGGNYYVASTITQTRLTPMADSAKQDDHSRKSRASTRTESSRVEQKEKRSTSKPRVVTWDLDNTHAPPSRFRSHSADPYEMTRKSAMRSKVSSGLNTNLANWRISSPEPSTHFLNLTADAKRKAESYYVNSDQRLLNILFENLMENKYLNRTSTLKQNQGVVEQSKFIKDKEKEISQQNETNPDSFTKLANSTSSSESNIFGSMSRSYTSPVNEAKSPGRSITPRLSEMPTVIPSDRQQSFNGNSNMIKTWTYRGEEPQISHPCSNNQNVSTWEKRLGVTQDLPTAPYVTSHMRSTRCDSPRSIGQKRNCRLVSSPVNVGTATMSLRDGHSRTIQTGTKSTIQSYTSSTTSQPSKRLQGDRSCHSVESSIAVPWRGNREMIGSPSFSSKRDLIASPSYRRDLIVSPSYSSKRNMIVGPSFNAKRDTVGSLSHHSKREVIWSPPCHSSLPPSRVLSPASSVAFDERAFSPRGSSPFRVISPSQGNSMISMQTISRSESALSARNTPQSETSVLRFVPSKADGMSGIDYRKQLYQKSLKVDSGAPQKYRPDAAAPVVPVAEATAQRARQI